MPTQRSSLSERTQPIDCHGRPATTTRTIYIDVIAHFNARPFSMNIIERTMRSMGAAQKHRQFSLNFQALKTFLKEMRYKIGTSNFRLFHFSSSRLFHKFGCSPSSSPKSSLCSFTRSFKSSRASNSLPPKPAAHYWRRALVYRGWHQRSQD